MIRLPKVIIVGRTNVGKSTLFNRLSTDVKSLTLDYEGVTRDFVKDIVCWQDRCFELIDSGGISIKKLEDPLAENVRKLGLELIQEEADVILFVCDGSVGPVKEDFELVRFLHKTKKPIVLVINKEDNKLTQEHLHEFVQLGLKQEYLVSAQHGTGINELLDAIIALLPEVTQVEEEKPAISITLLGKPNVGKSSLMNLLLKKERMLVSEIPGTTREAITEELRFYQETILVTDTPGIRRKRAIEEPIEKMMVKTSFRAIDRANIVLLLIDGSTGLLSDQELKLAFYVFQEGKSLILLINKSDAMEEAQRTALEEQFEYYGHLFNKIPHLYISCKTNKNIGKILPLMIEVWQRYTQRFSDVQLTMLLKNALQKRPLYHKTELLHIVSVKQISTAPITLLLLVNQPGWFGDSQLAFFDKVIRSEYDLKGVPILFVVRKAG